MLYTCKCRVCGREMEQDHEDGATPLCSDDCMADFDEPYAPVAKEPTP